MSIPLVATGPVRDRQPVSMSRAETLFPVLTDHHLADSFVQVRFLRESAAYLGCCRPRAGEGAAFSSSAATTRANSVACRASGRAASYSLSSNRVLAVFIRASSIP